MRTPGLLLAASLLCAPQAFAQDEPAAAADAPAAETAPAEPAGAEPTELIREWERPVVVAAIRADDRVPEEVLPQVAEAVATRLGPLADRRDVRPIADPDLLVRLAACPVEPPDPDATPGDGAPVPTPEGCLGAVFAEAQGEVGVLVRMSRRRPRRAPWQAVVTVHDRETGALRGEPVEVEIGQGDDLGEALAEPLAALEPAMPPPPPRQFLLVTTNVDGAAVRVGEQVIGETPVAAVELDPGRHVVRISKDGFDAQSRVVQMRPGQNLRINVDFDPGATVAGRYDWETGELVQEDEEKPWYLRWYTLTAAGAVVVGAVVVGIVVATSGDDDTPNPLGVPVPPLDPN